METVVRAIGLRGQPVGLVPDRRGSRRRRRLMRFSFSQPRPRVPLIAGQAIHPSPAIHPTDIGGSLQDSCCKAGTHRLETEISTYTGVFTMNTTIARRPGRYVALPVVGWGWDHRGAALGLAGMANAATPSYNPEPRPGIVAVPQTKAKPPPRPTPARGGTGITRRCSIRRPRRSSWRPFATTARSAPRSGSSTPSDSLACNVRSGAARVRTTAGPRTETPNPAHADTNARHLTHRFPRYIALPRHTGRDHRRRRAWQRRVSARVGHAAITTPASSPSPRPIPQPSIGLPLVP